MTRVEYFGIIGSRLIAECFAFICHYNLTAADIKKFRFSAYRRITTVYSFWDRKFVAQYYCYNFF